MSFTQEEIEFMDKEVNEDMEEQDITFESADDTEEYGIKIHYRSSDSEDSINGKRNKVKKERKRLYIIHRILCIIFFLMYYIVHKI